MKFRIHFIFLILIFAVFLSACTGGTTLVNSWPGVATDGKTVFLAYGSHVYGLNITNGNENWRYPEEVDRNQSFFATPSLTADGQLIVGGYDNILYSLNPESGQPNPWSFDQARSRYIGGPVAVDEIILAPSADTYLYALGLSGDLLWKTATEEAAWSQPASDGENAYLASLDHYLYAIDLVTGQEKWKVDLNGAIVSQPVVGDGLIYAGSFANQLYAINPENGAIVWTYPTENWVWASPTLHEGNLYFSDINGNVYAIDAETKEIQWDFKADSGIFSSPLIIGETLYFGTENGTVYSFKLDSEQNWSQTLGGKIYTSPIQANNLILVALMESDKVLVALDDKGIERWSFTPEQ